MSDKILYFNSEVAKARALIKNSYYGKLNISIADIKHIPYTMYVVAIAAKLAKLEVPNLTISCQIANFTEIFSIDHSDIDSIRQLYCSSLDDEVEASHYAMELNKYILNDPRLLESLAENIFKIATKNGAFNLDKIIFLRDVILALRFDEKYFLNNLRKYYIKNHKDPFKLFNIGKKVSYDDLKRVYRLCIRDCHPDKFSQKKITKEIKEIVLEQFNYYSQAYKAIKAKRGFY
jgi:hypothetical protein